MANAVAGLESGLQAMSALKAPGVSGSRIASLTAFCVDNVQVCAHQKASARVCSSTDFFSSARQSESVLVQKLYTHFKKTPGSHKLGVLYVVDSVTRKWLELAKAQGQTVDGSSKDGTFAAGIHRMRELIPVLMNDIIQSAPPTHKVSRILSRTVHDSVCRASWNSENSFPNECRLLARFPWFSAVDTTSPLGPRAIARCMPVSSAVRVHE